MISNTPPAQIHPDDYLLPHLSAAKRKLDSIAARLARAKHPSLRAYLEVQLKDAKQQAAAWLRMYHAAIAELPDSQERINQLRLL